MNDPKARRKPARHVVVDAPESPPARNRHGRRIARAKAGYSLMEILLVLAIIGMLVALVGPRLMKLSSGAQAKTAKIQVTSLKQALDTMNLDIGRYPTEQEGLGLLAAAPGGGVANWNGPYLQGAVPVDPWKNPYVYAPPAEGSDEPTITSLGKDGKPGGSGDDADISS